VDLFLAVRRLYNKSKIIWYNILMKTKKLKLAINIVNIGLLQVREFAENGNLPKASRYLKKTIKAIVFLARKAKKNQRKHFKQLENF
jgi:hypothetical protein